MSGILPPLWMTLGGPPGTLQDLPDNISGFGGCSLTLVSDGTYSLTPSGSGNWVLPATSAVAAFYQVRVTVLSGALTSGTTGTWLDLTSSRSWSETVSQSDILLEIREKATGIVRRSENINLDAT